jgi:DNA ligase-1
MFFAFSQTAEAVSQVSSRLEKARLLGEYFQTLTDADLRRAALYFGGHLFPLREGRTVNIGGAALFAATKEVSGADETFLRERLVARGDFGDVALEAYELWAAAPTEATVSLEAIELFLAKLAATAGSKAKATEVQKMLRLLTGVEAKYLVKMLSGDLRIGLKEGAVEDALARLAEQPVALVQRANMLTGDLGQVALLARHGNLETARFALFHPLKLMLATPAADLSDVAKQMPESFIVEDKFDGIRAQVHVAPHVESDDVLHGIAVGTRRVAIFSRTLDEITSAFSDLHASLAALLPEDSVGIVLDGEIVPVRGEQIAPFQELQKRLGRKVPTEEILASVPVAFVAYDALFAADILLEEPFLTRRAALETLKFDAQTARIATSKTFSDVMKLDEEFDAARARGNEGLMIKDPRSIYKPGRRGREWLKIKKAIATLDVVVTSVESGSGRRAKFYSDYTFAVRASETDETLLNVGKAYSGLTDVEISKLNGWFLEHTLQSFAHGRVRTVEPKIVLEITFDNVQASPRHKSGYALRFPRIVRIREDKSAGEIDTLETVRKLAEG